MGIRNSELDAEYSMLEVIPKGSLQLPVKYWFWMLYIGY